MPNRSETPAVGDVVRIHHPTPCCGYIADIGGTFIVASVTVPDDRFSFVCEYCGHNNNAAMHALDDDNSGEPIGRLMIIAKAATILDHTAAAKATVNAPDHQTTPQRTTLQRRMTCSHNKAS